MKKIILIGILLLTIGCELHKQDIYSKDKQRDSLFQMEAMDKMFFWIISDDYFSLEEILKDNVDLNILNRQGQNLLIEAIKLKSDLISNLFLDKGADPQISDVANQTSFDIIVKFEDAEAWKSLLEGNGFPKEFLDKKVVSLVSKTAEDMQQETIKKLALYFERGADVNARNKRKYTLLIIASSKNLAELVTFLCKTDGIDINAQAGRYNALSLTRRLARRKPELNRIVQILKSCTKVSN